MNLEDKEQELISDYDFIENPMERFGVIVDQANSFPSLPQENRREEDLVEGCSSQVWLYAEQKEGTCHFHADADSTIVRAIALLLVRLYTGAKSSEIISYEPTFLDTLKINDQLSPTRRNGMNSIRARMVALAQDLQ